MARDEQLKAFIVARARQLEAVRLEERLAEILAMHQSDGAPATDATVDGA